MQSFDVKIIHDDQVKELRHPISNELVGLEVYIELRNSYEIFVDQLYDISTKSIMAAGMDPERISVILPIDSIEDKSCRTNFWIFTIYGPVDPSSVYKLSSHIEGKIPSEMIL